MALTWQARAAFRLTGALTALQLLPSQEKILAAPMAKRLATKPPKGLLGSVPDVATQDHAVPTRDGASLRARSYRRHHAASPTTLLYLHGGGFVVGGVEGCDHICRRLAQESGATVFSLEYRLAPEHRYPGPLHDARDAVAWLDANGPELLIDPADLIVAGDSAGGNLAAALALTLRDEGRPARKQLLLYPALDLTLSTLGMQTYRGVGLTTDDCRFCATHYLGGQDPADPYASPLLAADFHGLPETFVLTVGHDPLHDEGQLYVERCRRDDVRVRHVDLPDQVHGSLSLPRLYHGIDELYAQIADFLTVRADDPLTGRS